VPAGDHEEADRRVLLRSFFDATPLSFSPE
jgi:hypothetical protein